MLVASSVLGQDKAITILGAGFDSSLYVTEDGSITKLITLPEMIFNRGQYELSPDRQLVAAISSAKGFSQNAKGQFFVDHKLLVISLDGSILHEIPNAQTFAWSPDSKRIAYVSGVDLEGFGFVSKSINILDVKSGATKTFPALNDYDLSWAPFDKMLYTTNYLTVYQINPSNGNRHKTDYRGIYFSHDGRYYFKPNYEGGSFGVYERSSNKEITEQVLADSISGLAFQQWIPGSNTLIVGSILGTKKVVDVNRKVTIQSIAGNVIGFDATRKELILLKKDHPSVTPAEASVQRIAVKLR